MSRADWLQERIRATERIPRIDITRFFAQTFGTRLFFFLFFFFFFFFFSPGFVLTLFREGDFIYWKLGELFYRVIFV